MTALHPDTARQAVRLSQAGWGEADAAAELGLDPDEYRQVLHAQVHRGLSVRRIAALQATADGMSTRQAANELGVSAKSIRNYLMDARRALGVDTTDDAVARARELRLIR